MQKTDKLLSNDPNIKIKGVQKYISAKVINDVKSQNPNYDLDDIKNHKKMRLTGLEIFKLYFVMQWNQYAGKLKRINSSFI